MLQDDEILEAAVRLTPQWLAGFFDGEGTVCAYKSIGYWRVSVQIPQKDARILALIALKFPGGSGPDANNTTLNGKKFRNFRVTWYGRSAIPILEFIKDHVVCKRQQVENGLKLAQVTPERSSGRVSVPNADEREQLAAVIKEANHG